MGRGCKAGRDGRGTGVRSGGGGVVCSFVFFYIRLLYVFCQLQFSAFNLDLTVSQIDVLSIR